MNIKHHFFLYLLMAAIVFQSCGTAKYMKGGDYLLKKNEIIIEEAEKIENKSSLKYELSTLYKQKDNGKFFFIPREWFHFKTQPPKEGKAFRSWISRTIAERPAIYQEDLSGQTADAMRRYLAFKGYYDAEVLFEDAQRGKAKIGVKYYVYPKKRYRIDSVSFSSEDPIVDSILWANQNKSLFKKGLGLDGKLYELEKARITRQLRNLGYADFFANYIPYMEVDTTIAPQKAHIQIQVNPPYNDSLHQVYTVGQITVYPEYNITLAESAYRDTVIRGITFRNADFDFLVKPQVILDAIQFQEGRIYRQIDFDQTNQLLDNLSIFRFVRIKEQADSLNPLVLNFRIELTPNKLNEFGFDFELDYTNRSNTTGAGNLIGISGTPSLRNRNFLRGAEVMVGNLSSGVEINPEDNRFWNTIDFGIQADLYLPRFRDFLGFWKTINRLSFNRDREEDEFSAFYSGLNTEGSTRIRASYNYVLLLDFYRYTLLTASYGYDFQPDQSHRYIINNLAIDFFNPNTQMAFNDLLEANTFLERSFGDQLFVSLLFREFNYVFNGPTNRLGERRYFSFNVETAGGEIWASNSIYNAFASEADTFNIGKTDFSQYIRLEGDLRYFRSYGPKNSIASRLAIGLARPFGFSQDVPYVKQFYVGGPNSIRAWPARSLGPGGFIDSLTLDNNNPLLFYQSGDLKLEFNIEYRFNIISRLNGAVFLDGGNIWTLRSDSSRPESQFLLKSKTVISESGQPIVADPFYKQIAIGTGFGFRFDFTYFIFRLDLGTRLKYPYKWKNDQYWVAPSDWLKDVNFNFSLGYPF